ncbi:MAG: CarD family transcriptional regulator, partial [Spirochaetia bacterium]
MERHFAASRPFAALKAALGRNAALEGPGEAKNGGPPSHGVPAEGPGGVPGAPVRIVGPKGAYLALVLDALQGRAAGPSLVVTPSEREAEGIVQDTDSFGTGRSVLFPWWGTAPYEGASPLASLFGERVQILTRLLAREPLMVVAPLRALLTPVPDPSYLAAQVFTLARGQRLDPQGTADRLAAAGYLRVPTVTVHGEFALRGEVIDVYSPGQAQAFRITLDFDTVAGIRSFDPLDQASTGNLEKVEITPCRELIFTAELLEEVRSALNEQGFGEEEISERVSAIADDPESGGVELFYPLCFQKQHSILDYLGESARVFLVDGDRLLSSAAALRKEHLELFRRARSRKQIVPGPQKILLDYGELLQKMPRRIEFPLLPGEPEPGTAGSLHVLPCDGPRSFFGNFTFFREEVESSLKNGYKVFIFAVYDVQADRLRHILKELPVTILPESISAGFALPEQKILVIQEGEIFGRKRRIPRSVGAAKSAAIESFVELNPGDFVVHVNYGIGVFLGIERISAAGNERDYITLEYSDGEKLFIPIEQVNLIQRYIGQEGKKPKLDSLGGKGWARRKEKAQKAVEELAQGLLELYSRRKGEPGFAFNPDTDWQSEFEAAFPYQETEDQLKCIEDVKKDMESPVPMDRLVCGDVGYGKTEIALRAAFKAVMSGKQVALLAPTTILVEQHFETFRDRFSRFPVKIAMLSRFRSPKEMKT